MTSEQSLLYFFNEYNKRYFDGQILPTVNFIVRYSNTEKYAGWFNYCLKTHFDLNISIARRLAAHPRALRSTLVHEMIHMLAHQRFRETGDVAFLDLHPVSNQAFVNKGHGAFFHKEMDRLNQLEADLGLSVSSCFGDALYEQDKIPKSYLLIVEIDKAIQKGMIYRLHRSASINWPTLHNTVFSLHGATSITLLHVSDRLAEGFPYLRKDNLPRHNMKKRSLRNFSLTLSKIKADKTTVFLLEPSQLTHPTQRKLALQKAS